MKLFDYYIFIDFSENYIGYFIIDHIKLMELVPKISKFAHYRGVRYKRAYIKSIRKIIKREKIVVVPHGVIINLPKKLPKKEKKKTVIFLGALAKDKGIEDAIKTFGVLNEHDNFQFWVVGRGDESYLQYLKKLTKKFGIDKKITFFVLIVDIIQEV